MAGDRSASPSESESRTHYNRFSNEMSNDLFDSRAFSDNGENQGEFYYGDEDYGDDGYNEERGYYDGGYHVEENHHYEERRSSSPRRSRHRSREYRRH